MNDVASIADCLHRESQELVQVWKRRRTSNGSLAWYVTNRHEIGLQSDSVIGSSLHCMRALRYPRWEDYDYERADSSKNRLYWLGDGMTHNEVTLSGNSKSSYQLCMTFH